MLLKFVWAEVVAAILLCGVAFTLDSAPSRPSPATPRIPGAAAGQTVQPNPGQTPSSPRIVAGTIIPVQLMKTVDAKKAKNGDPVEARVTQDLRTGSGEVFLSKDTKIIGHITETQVRDKEHSNSQVGIVFDRALMKNGTEIQLRMLIQAIIAPQPSIGSNNAGTETASQGPGSSGGGMAGGNSARVGGMNGGMAPPAPSPSAIDTDPSPSSQTNSHQPITRETQGVVGISNLKLGAGTSRTQDSLVSSDKSNVKLESGILMLLRVN
jgi:hypothetical protein